MTPIKIAHSPDADDAFMFAPLLQGKVEKGSLEFFPLRTVINCREILSLPRADIEEKAGQRRIEVAGDLPGEILSQIDRIVAASKLITPTDKKRILGA